MRLSILLLILVSIVKPALSQNKQLSIEDAIIGRYTYLLPDQPRQLQWKNDETLVYVKNDTLWSETTKNASPSVFLTLDELQKTGTSFSRFPAISFLNEDQLKIVDAKNILIYNLNTKQVQTTLTAPDESDKLDFCKANNHLAYVKGQNLFVLNEEKETQVTFETQPEILCGHEVHRREFGIEKGTFWSTTGKYLAFYRKNETMVKDYPLVDFMAREAEYTPVRYPMAGMTSHQVTLGIYNTETGKTLFLNTGEPDEHYLTNISWGPNDQYIYMAELNREQNHMELNQYDVATGEKVKTLFEETSETYVEPQHPLQFSKTNPNQFYYWSRKDGWDQIYLYDTTGKPVRQLTKGEWEVTGFYGTDLKEKNIFIQATKESPLDRDIYKVEIATGKIQKLNLDAGTHQALFSPNKTSFLDKWTAFDVPAKADLVRADGKFIRSVHESKNTAADYQFGENKIITIKAADNKTDLYGRLILPPNFDASKKYPVIIYVYGGPHAQLVNNTWHNDARWWQYYMASKGYISFTLDSRGSANRGQAFEDVIHRQLGIEETADQMKGVDYLKSLPYVDSNRIGVHGWSYGGFMTLNLMTRQSDVFKVGVAGGPVVDWELYEIMYGERYMDMPQENPEGYKNSNMINHVNELNGKLLIIHGVQDETVVMQHSMKFLRECVKQNKPVDFFAYPTHEHNVRGKDRVHLMTKVSQYFIDYL